MEDNQNNNENGNQEGEENEEILDDDYLMQLHKYLQEMKIK